MKRIPKEPAHEIPFEGLDIFASEFILSRQEELAKLFSASEKSDFQTIERVCHTWRGFAVPYGFGELGQLATEIEKACEEKNIQLCQVLLKDVEDYLSSK